MMDLSQDLIKMQNANDCLANISSGNPQGKEKAKRGKSIKEKCSVRATRKNKKATSTAANILSGETITFSKNNSNMSETSESNRRPSIEFSQGDLMETMQCENDCLIGKPSDILQGSVKTRRVKIPKQKCSVKAPRKNKKATSTAADISSAEIIADNFKSNSNIPDFTESNKRLSIEFSQGDLMETMQYSNDSLIGISSDNPQDTVQSGKGKILKQKCSVRASRKNKKATSIAADISSAETIADNSKGDSNMPEITESNKKTSTEFSQVDLLETMQYVNDCFIGISSNNPNSTVKARRGKIKKQKCSVRASRKNKNATQIAADISSDETITDYESDSNMPESTESNKILSSGFSSGLSIGNTKKNLYARRRKNLLQKVCVKANKKNQKSISLAAANISFAEISADHSKSDANKLKPAETNKRQSLMDMVRKFSSRESITPAKIINKISTPEKIKSLSQSNIINDNATSSECRASNGLIPQVSDKFCHEIYEKKAEQVEIPESLSNDTICPPSSMQLLPNLKKVISVKTPKNNKTKASNKKYTKKEKVPNQSKKVSKFDCLSTKAKVYRKKQVSMAESPIANKNNLDFSMSKSPKSLKLVSYNSVPTNKNDINNYLPHVKVPISTTESLEVPPLIDRYQQTYLTLPPTNEELPENISFGGHPAVPPLAQIYIVPVPCMNCSKVPNVPGICNSNMSLASTPVVKLTCTDTNMDTILDNITKAYQKPESNILNLSNSSTATEGQTTSTTSTDENNILSSPFATVQNIPFEPVKDLLNNTETIDINNYSPEFY